jgi:dienelactone hydrolase
MPRLTAYVLLLTAASCGLSTPRAGEVVAPGVGRALFEVRASGTDLVRVTVYFPAREDGTARPGPRPGVVFIQGGFVATTRYAWQAIALAEAGYVVAVPENALELAFFTVDYGQSARQLLAKPPEGSLLDGLVDEARIAVAGHSLGSVVAMKLALQGNFAAVALEAGFPDTADLSKLASFRRPSLALAGALDCSAKLANVRQGWERLPAPTALAVLAGVTHYQFTDSEQEDQQKKCFPAQDLATSHEHIRRALLGFLEAALGDGGVGEAALREIAGVTVEVR